MFEDFVQTHIKLSSSVEKVTVSSRKLLTSVTANHSIQAKTARTVFTFLQIR